MTDIVRDMSPGSLARASEANLAKGMAACALAYGGEVCDEPDLLWCATGLPASGWNRVTRAQLAPESVGDGLLRLRAPRILRAVPLSHVPLATPLTPLGEPGAFRTLAGCTRGCWLKVERS
jgi:hypothetical protein